MRRKSAAGDFRRADSFRPRMCSPGVPGRPAAWGRNAATAGAQVPGKGVDEVNDMLLQAIDAYLEEE